MWDTSLTVSFVARDVDSDTGTGVILCRRQHLFTSQTHWTQWQYATLKLNAVTPHSDSNWHTHGHYYVASPPHLTPRILKTSNKPINISPYSWLNLWHKSYPPGRVFRVPFNSHSRFHASCRKLVTTRRESAPTCSGSVIGYTASHRTATVTSQERKEQKKTCGDKDFTCSA